MHHPFLENSCINRRVRSPVEATFLSGVFSPLTSAEACEKSSWWLWKEKLCSYWCEKARKHICVTDRHDMTLAVKVALNPNTTNQLTQYWRIHAVHFFLLNPCPHRMIHAVPRYWQIHASPLYRNIPA